MRTKLLAAATAAALSLGAVSAEAMPTTVIGAPVLAPHVTLVAGFCGLGFHRAPFGRCVPNGRVVIRRVRPVFGRVCVTRRFGFGVRRVCR